jgi:hypothetical protein
MELTTLIGFIIIVTLGMLLVNKMNINMFGIKLNFSKSSKDKVHQLVHLVKEYTISVHTLTDHIIKNQMLHAEGIVLHIINELESKCDDAQLIRIKYNLLDSIKDRIMKNNFTELDPHDFQDYVNSRIIEFGNILDKIIGNNEYSNSINFRNKISDIFCHAASCYKYNNDKLKEITLQYQKDYDALVKEIN